jgi:4-hydroxy-4-methyl-2-oxoglutarate aldolase
MSFPSELLEELRRISLCQLADCLGSDWPIETRIRPLDPAFRLCGPAMTVACEPDDNLTLHHALHIAPPDCVLVVSAGGGCGAALWGELMSISAQSKGLIGTILDGAARDPVEIKSLGYPVFARAVTPRKARKEKYGQLGSALRCGAVLMNPGDIVCADANGVLAIPSSDVAEVVSRALNLAQREADLRQELQNGRTIFEISQLDRLLPDRRGGKNEP